MQRHYNSHIHFSTLAHSVIFYRWKAQYSILHVRLSKLQHILKTSSGRSWEVPKIPNSRIVQQHLWAQFPHSATKQSFCYPAISYKQSITDLIIKRLLHFLFYFSLRSYHSPGRKTTTKNQPPNQNHKQNPLPKKSRKIICIWRTTFRSSAVCGCRTDWPNCFSVLGFKPDVLTAKCLSRRRKEMHQIKCEKIGSASFWHLW